MNANQIINMVVRMVTRRLMRTGVNKGLDMMSKGKAAKGGQPAPDARETGKRARQTMRIARRFGRM